MVILRSAQVASLFQPVARPSPVISVSVSGSRSPGQISSFRRDSVLGLPGTLDFHAPGILSALTQRCWHNLTPRSASLKNRALDRRVFFLVHLEISRFAQKHPVPCSPALVLCAALSRVRGPTIQPLTPVLGQIQGTKSTSPPWRTSRYRYVGSVASHPSELEKPRTQAPNAQLPPQTCSQLLHSQAFLSLVPGSRALVPPSRFMPLCQESSRGHFMGPSRVDRCLRHGMGSSQGWRTTPALRWKSG